MVSTGNGLPEFLLDWLRRLRERVLSKGRPVALEPSIRCRLGTEKVPFWYVFAVRPCFVCLTSAKPEAATRRWPMIRRS